MMAHQEIIDHQILERYVRGQLMEAQAARFEEHYLTCEECVRDLELAERLRRGLGGVAAEDALRAGTLATLSRAVAQLASRRWIPLLAVLLVAVLPLAQWLHYGAQQENRAVLAPEVVLPLAVERSAASAGPRLTLLPEMQWVALEVDPGLEIAPVESFSHQDIPYRIAGPGGDDLLQGTTRGTAGSTTFLLVLEADRLEDGEHRLWLGPGAGLAQPLRFPFRVERTDSTSG